MGVVVLTLNCKSQNVVKKDFKFVISLTGLFKYSLLNNKNSLFLLTKFLGEKGSHIIVCKIV